MKKHIKRLLLSISTLILMISTGCISVGGTQNTQNTTGKELTDLKQALENDAITPEEYEVQKARILSR